MGKRNIAPWATKLHLGGRGAKRRSLGKGFEMDGTTCGITVGECGIEGLGLKMSVQEGIY